MDQLPLRIENVQALEELLSRPSPILVEYISGLEGDILILGAGGKIGPTMARMAHRAFKEAGKQNRVIAVGRSPLEKLAQFGIETLQCDMLDLDEVKKLPQCRNIVYMVGRKFGSTGREHLTWAANTAAPHNVAQTFTGSRILVFSTGCVYPVVDVRTGGSVETDPPDPIGEYAMSCLGRERMFDYYATEKGEKVVHIRLNYALDLRYGVLVDIATKVYSGEPVDVTTGFLNGIWQGDCCAQVLRCFELAASPATILNVTGPEMLSVRWIAHRFGELFGKEANITGEENGKGYLSNASKANTLLGNPSVAIGKVIEWTADWVQRGGESLDKPTHFEAQDGKY